MAQTYLKNGYVLSMDANDTVYDGGGAQEKIQGFEITKRCTGCKACENVCPQNCIEFTNVPAVINQKHCLHCGKCLEICPQKAVVRRK